MLEPAGPSALIVSWLWWGMFIFFSIVAVFMTGIWLYAMRQNKSSKWQINEKLSRWLIIGGGILLPTISIIVLLVFGIPLGQQLLPLPLKNETLLKINITGHQWWWEVNYPDLKITLINELHIPVNVPINIYAMSADVIHSFWIPSLAGKIDMIPGYKNVMRIQASKTGFFRGQCSEFCGLRHANMILPVWVHTESDFALWKTNQQNLKPKRESP